MILHLVLIRLKPEVSKDDERVVQALGALVALRDQVEGVVRWEAGWDILHKPHSYDFALAACFEQRAHLDAYGPHPAHQAVVGRLREVADWVLVDVDLDAERQQD